MPKEMISFFSLTNIRLNGCFSLMLTLGINDSSPGTARSFARRASIESGEPATNRLIPSVLSRIVPFRPHALQSVISDSRNSLRPDSSAKRYVEIFVIADTVQKIIKHGALLVKNAEADRWWLAGSEQRFHQLRLLTFNRFYSDVLQLSSLGIYSCIVI